MSFKQFFIQKLSLFFMLSTMIMAAICVIGSIYDADARFGYAELLTPLRFAACCVIPTFVTYSKRELKPKELKIRMLLEFLLLEAVVLGIAFASPVIDTGRLSVVLVIAGSVLLIYVSARFFSWLRNYAEARKLNEDLLQFQKMQEESL